MKFYIHRERRNLTGARSLVSAIALTAFTAAGAAFAQGEDAASAPAEPIADESSTNATPAMEAVYEAGSAESSTEILPTIPVDSTVQAEAPVSAEDAPRADAIEEVIVTATKREQSARDIPVTVNAYSGEDLMQRGATNLEELVNLQPGVSKNGERVVMRGVATSALSSYATSEEVGRFLGETSLSAPAGRGALVDLDPFDMASIEVAKGPQGTLFGGTALAGAVRYIPARPDVESNSVAVRGAVGKIAHSDDLQKEANLMLNGSIADSLGLRLVGSFRDRPGVIDDLFADKPDIDTRELRQWRALGSWQPNEAFALDLTYFHWEEKRGDLGLTDNPDRYETEILRSEEPILSKNAVYNARAEYRWEPASVVASVSRLKTEFNNITDLSGVLGVQDVPVGAALNVHTRTPRTVNYELRLVSNDPTESRWWMLRDWDYLIGVFKLETNTFIDSKADASPTAPGIPVLDELTLSALNQQFLTEASEKAVFFDLTRGLFDREVEINLGGRFARSRLDGTSYVLQNGQRVNSISDGTGERRFNPKVAATWHLSDDLSIYASAAQGFRFGGFNANPSSGVLLPRTFDSDSLWNYEIGVRTDWLDRTLRLDVTAFRIDWDDIQVQLISPASENYADNVGGAKIIGTEAALRWNLPSDWSLIPAGLSISMSGSYIDARTTEDFESPEGPVPADSRLPLTPYVQASGSLNWSSSIGSWVTLVSVSNAYAGERKNQLFETKRLPSFQTLGAVLSISNPSLSFRPELSLSGTNLLDEPANAFAIEARTGDNFLYGLNRPRTLLLSLQLSFDAS